MKIGRNIKEMIAKGGDAHGTNKQSINESKRRRNIIGVVAVTFVLVLWVSFMGWNAERTVAVVMTAQQIDKNTVITENMLIKHDMVKAEFDKYAVVSENGTKKRRLILWEERGEIINSFAAYPLKAEAYLEYRDCVKSRTDNSDSVLYSFPGKDIVKLSVDSGDLQAFKTFLKPGDKLCIDAIYNDKRTVGGSDGYGYSQSTIDVVKQEEVFNAVMIADLINSDGESILDIYTGYNNMTVWQQAQLDSSDSFKKRTAPTALLVALTPEEKTLYRYYLSKPNIKFHVSLPQRSN